MRSLLVVLLVLGCRDEVKETGSVDTSGAVEVDEDGDGYGTPEDCNDADSAIHPDAAERCDDVDNDCDGLVDDEDPQVVDADEWYLDFDLDGYGGDQLTLVSCEQPDGYVDNHRDCQDADDSVHPDAVEICDGLDNDCDGVVDGSDATDGLTWYSDADGDGYGTTDTMVTACDPPAGFALHDGDCDDADPGYNPGALESDCSDPEDYNCDGSVGYEDADADGFAACEDCDDSSADANDDASEVCDGLDNDCDGDIDGEDGSLTGATTFYGDSDGDGYGGSQYQAQDCSAPPGFVENTDDCDDLDAFSHPGASEICDTADNDCDGDVDEGVGSTWYQDSDSDGYGNGSVSLVSCDVPSGYVGNALDCDDFTSSTNPGSFEVCDGQDNDCDGSVDEDAINATDFYVDGDSDGYGSSGSSTSACETPTGYADNDSDCDDADGSVNPVATELCDSVDNDCDGSVDESDSADASAWYQDLDGDGFGNGASDVSACTQPSGYVADPTDCDDTSASTNTDGTELCDLVDNDCDGTVDEGDASDASTWFADTDSDNYGDANTSTTACLQPTGYVADSTDCNDTDSNSNPGAVEVCDTVDNDCDTSVDENDATDASTWYVDSDGDGYGGVSSTTACLQPTGYANNADDCDDSSANTSPAASESCDGVDNNCDGNTDETLLGTGAACGATDCAAIQNSSTTTPSNGVYYVNPDGGTAYEAYCDFTTSGGPWTWHSSTEPAAYWSFDGADVTASDVGSYSGSLHGATNQASQVPFTGFGSSLQSDNNDSGYVQLNSNVPMSSASTSPQYTFTIAFWGYNDNCNNNQIAILFTNGNYMADLYHESSYRGDNTFAKSASCSNHVNTWRHFVYVDDGSSLRAWIDGVEVSPSDYSYSAGSDPEINRLMSRPSFGTNGLGGYIDDLVIYYTALSTAEIERLYNQGVAGRPVRWQ